jgi:hypothetical protein
MSENNTQLSNATSPIQRPKRKSWKWKFFLVSFLILAFTIYFLFFKPFSIGHREGFVTKLSKKGYIFKTWEGELRTNVLSLSDANTFIFSVANDHVVDKLNKIDQRVYVKLYYKQYILRAFFKGDTKYFIDSVEILANQGMPTTMPNALPPGYINK